MNNHTKAPQTASLECEFAGHAESKQMDNSILLKTESYDENRAWLLSYDRSLANIMRRDPRGDYILLDAGLAFDTDGESISVSPVGTPLFFSPEQFDFTNRRTVLDFRSDMFALGTTMYCLATGVHPFWASGDNSQSIYTKITTHIPPVPSTIVAGFPAELDEVIMRLLGKSPHLRYRKCDQLIAALQGL